MKKDLRSPLAKARDKWLESERGKECINPVGIGVLECNRMYLRNRIESAFIAGWNAKEELDSVA